MAFLSVFLHYSEALVHNILRPYTNKTVLTAILLLFPVPILVPVSAQASFRFRFRFKIVCSSLFSIPVSADNSVPVDH